MPCRPAPSRLVCLSRLQRSQYAHTPCPMCMQPMLHGPGSQHCPTCMQARRRQLNEPLSGGPMRTLLQTDQLATFGPTIALGSAIVAQIGSLTLGVTASVNITVGRRKLLSTLPELSFIGEVKKDTWSGAAVASYLFDASTAPFFAGCAHACACPVPADERPASIGLTAKLGMRILVGSFGACTNMTAHAWLCTCNGTVTHEAGGMQPCRRTALDE